MPEDRDGQVVTFYSYKGGAGRTMALANVAWILAANGKRVLVVDWDLESPGLHKYFEPFMPANVIAGAAGVIDLIRDYEWATADVPENLDDLYRSHANAQKHAFSVVWDFPNEGRLDFLGAGKQNHDYAATLAGLDWDDFYARKGGGRFFDELRADMKRRYDYTLIDSRTGFSDVADICTIHMPDVLVDCFTPSAQGTEGAVRVATAVRSRYRHRNIRILPVAMRIDDAEKEKAEASREIARQMFGNLPADMSDAERRDYWTGTFVPYQAYYAYEETLATFGDPPGVPTSLLSAYETLTAHITSGVVRRLPPIPEAIRTRTKRKFARLPVRPETAVLLHYEPYDQVWAEWIAYVLNRVDIRVHDAQDPDMRSGAPGVRDVYIMSGSPDTLGGTAGDPFAIYVADGQSFGYIPASHSALIGNLTADRAAERILQLVRRSPDNLEETLAAGPRFPGTDPAVFNAPGRNARFTGREADLRTLRELLRSRGRATTTPRSLPVALCGMGGIGKSQVAIEYVHRFRHAYDVIWWVDADPNSGIDAQVAELGRQLGLPGQSTMPESVRAVRAALNQSGVAQRWLFVFDNAEDPDTVAALLPQGANGHVLITSRDPHWADRAHAIPVDVFQREESIVHLLKRASHVSRGDADRLAELLGDLPIAISAAAAWLADTRESVEEYIDKIEHRPRYGRGDDHLNQVIEATWDVSLRRLGERSPAALRMLQLCSVMAPEIAVDLLYSDGFAQAVLPEDPRVSERMWRGSLIQQIAKLSLLRLDTRPSGRSEPGGVERGVGQIIMHRLLQYAVRNRMTNEQLARTREQVHTILAANRPARDVEDLDSHERFHMIWPHLEPSEASLSIQESVRQLLIDRVRYLYLVGDIDRGLKLARNVEQHWTSMLATQSDPTTAAELRRQLLYLQFNIANLIRDLGSFAESRELDRQILAEQRDLLGPEHPHTLMTAGSLAADLRGLGLYAEALPMAEDTYTAWLDAFGEDNPRTLAALNNLAVSYRLIGSFREAQVRDEAAYARYRNVSGETSPRTLGSATNLGRDYRELGEYDRSVTLLTHVLETTNRTLRPDSRSAMKARSNLAVSLRTAGRIREAAEHLEAAYDGFLKLVDEDHPERLTCQLSRALNMLEAGQSEVALDELQAVWRLYKASLGPSHPHTLACVNNIAAALHATGRDAEGLVAAQEAHDGFVEALGSMHPYSVATFMNLAVSASTVGDHQLAVPSIEEAASRMETVLGQDHPQVLRCRANREVIRQRGGTTPATAELDAILRLLAERLHPQHPIVAGFKAGKMARRLIDPHPF